MSERASGARTAVEVVVRAMQARDIPAMLAIQAESYPPETLEDEATMRARFQCFPDCAWVAVDPAGVCAYLVAYRSLLGKVSRLGSVFARVENPDCMYVHDLAISRRARGAALGSRLVAGACAQAIGEGLTHSALVSVHGSRGFWSALGYRVAELPEPLQRRHLASYPGQGWYMVRTLPVPR